MPAQVPISQLFLLFRASRDGRVCSALARNKAASNAPSGPSFGTAMMQVAFHADIVLAQDYCDLTAVVVVLLLVAQGAGRGGALRDWMLPSIRGFDHCQGKLGRRDIGDFAPPPSGAERHRPLHGRCTCRHPQGSPRGPRQGAQPWRGQQDPGRHRSRRGACQASFARW